MITFDMEMPESCARCPLKNTFGECQKTKYSVIDYAYFGIKPDNCPCWESNEVRTSDWTRTEIARPNEGDRVLIRVHRDDYMRPDRIELAYFEDGHFVDKGYNRNPKIISDLKIIDWRPYPENHKK